MAIALTAVLLAAGQALASTLLGAVRNASNLSGAAAVAVAGPYAYTTSYWPGQLTTVKLANPANPTIVGATPPETYLENAVNVTLAGHDAFVVSKNRNASPTSNDDGSGNSLTIVDVSSPANPRIVGHLQDPDRLFGAYGIAVAGHLAYVAAQGILAGQATAPRTSYGSFSVIDVGNPASPSIVGHIDNGPVAGGHNYLEHATSVAISGHFAYVTAFYDKRVTVIDISRPRSPRIVTSLRDAQNLPFPNDLTIQGSYAYVTNQADAHQFTVLDISKPAHPKVAASLTAAVLSGAYRIRTGGGFAFIAASGAAAVAAIDISNPLSPALVSSLQDPGHLNATIGIDPAGPGRLVAASPRLASEGTRNVPPFPTNTGTVSVVALTLPPVATGSLTGVAGFRPRLQLAVAPSPDQAPLKRVTISLPPGLSLSRLKGQLARGIGAIDPHGRKIGFRASIVRGSLVLVLKRAPASVQITIGGSALSASPGLARKVRQGKTRRLRIAIAFADTRRATHRLSAVVPVA